MEHTKGKWTVEPYLTPDRDDDPLGVYKIQPVHDLLTEKYFAVNCEDEDEEEQFAALHEENAANAAYIVRCVNSHEALVQAARDALDALRQFDTDFGAMPPVVIQKLEAALAAAEEE